MITSMDSRAVKPSTGSVQVIAIDGPMGSGLTSTAVQLSLLLGWRCISTGLMYRVIASEVAHLPSAQRAAGAIRSAEATTFDFQTEGSALRVLANGVDLTT